DGTNLGVGGAASYRIHGINNADAFGIVGMFEARLYEDIVLRMDDGWRDLFLPLADPKQLVKDDVLRIRVEYTPGRYDSFV
ncbi:MAG: hypothetical protein ACFFB7_03255, partial [Candidatus Sifarchaeia archaeon]